MYVLVDTANPSATHTFETLDALKAWLEPSTKVDKTADILLTVKELLESIDIKLQSPSISDANIHPVESTTKDETDVPSISQILTQEKTSDCNTYVSTTVSTLKSMFTTECLLDKHPGYTCNTYYDNATYISMCFKLWIMYPEMYSATTIADDNKDFIKLYEHEILNKPSITQICGTKYIKYGMFKDYFDIVSVLYASSLSVKYTDKEYAQIAFNLLHSYYRFGLGLDKQLEIFIEQYATQKLRRINTSSLKSSVLYDSFIEWFKFTYTNTLSNIRHPKNMSSLLDTILIKFTNKRFTILFEEMTDLKTVRKSDGNYWQNIDFCNDIKMPNIIMKKHKLEKIANITEYLPSEDSLDTTFATTDWPSEIMTADQISEIFHEVKHVNPPSK